MDGRIVWGVRCLCRPSSYSPSICIDSILYTIPMVNHLVRPWARFSQESLRILRIFKNALWTFLVLLCLPINLLPQQSSMKCMSWECGVQHRNNNTKYPTESNQGFSTEEVGLEGDADGSLLILLPPPSVRQHCIFQLRKMIFEESDLTPGTKLSVCKAAVISACQDMNYL